MKKQEYLTPETACVFVEIEATLCQSANASVDPFVIEGADDYFNMFNIPIL